MSTEETACRGPTCDPDDHNTMEEAGSQAAGDRVKSPRSHIDFAPEVLLGTQDVRGKTFIHTTKTGIIMTPVTKVTRVEGAEDMIVSHHEVM